MATEQEQKPSFSVSLDDFNGIKDFRWAIEVAKDYALLSSDGKLCHGSGQGPLTNVMEDVDSGMLYVFIFCLESLRISVTNRILIKHRSVSDLLMKSIRSS